MKTTVIVIIGSNFRKADAKKRWSILDVDGAETERLLLGQGEINGEAGYLYAYTCETEDSKVVEAELRQGDATIIGIIP